VTPGELTAKLNTKLANWADKCTGDILDIIRRGVMSLPPGSALVPEVVKAQLRVIIGFAIREAALAGQQLQARLQNPKADAAVMREDKPLTGVTATARRVVSDLRPREHVTQRFPAVVGWDDEITEVMPPRKPIPDIGDE
jgi:hypothetical protein